MWMGAIPKGATNVLAGHHCQLEAVSCQVSVHARGQAAAGPMIAQPDGLQASYNPRAVAPRSP
jgi:hypothetical protein